jgi:hypothetical protein
LVSTRIGLGQVKVAFAHLVKLRNKKATTKTMLFFDILRPFCDQMLLTRALSALTNPG